MEVNYERILDFILKSGERLRKKAGKIDDIGVSKIDLTEEDLAIERGFKEILKEFGEDHVLYAEEENDAFLESENIWVVDPISGTRGFIKGEKHYAIVIAHVLKGKIIFAAVYDPSVDELFTAYLDKGAFLNNLPINTSRDKRSVILRPSSQWKNPEIIEKAKEKLSGYKIENNPYSMAVNYCSVACGRFDGVASFTKDSFPEFAGGFILQQAGGIFTNIEGHSDIKHHDRIFVGGNKDIYPEIFLLIKNIV